jgi:hypothetical protein
MAHASDLGSPPEFRPDGGDPPLTSPPIVVVDRLVPVEVVRRPSLKDLARAVSFSLSVAPRIDISQIEEARKWTELRRFRSTMYWEREPQTLQLAPGVTTERSVRIMVGLSQEQTRTFADAVAIKSGADVKVLRAEVEEKWSTSLGERLLLEQQQEHTETLRLENPTSDAYRRFAIWTVVHEFAVDRMDGIELTRHFEPEELEQLRSIPSVWKPVNPPVSVIVSSTVVTSSIDVQRPTAG